MDAPTIPVMFSMDNLEIWAIAIESNFYEISSITFSEKKTWKAGHRFFQLERQL